MFHTISPHDITINLLIFHSIFFLYKISRSPTCGICTIHLPGLESPEVRALASTCIKDGWDFFWDPTGDQKKPRHHKFFCNTMIEILPSLEDFNWR